MSVLQCVGVYRMYYRDNKRLQTISNTWVRIYTTLPLICYDARGPLSPRLQVSLKETQFFFFLITGHETVIPTSVSLIVVNLVLTLFLVLSCQGVLT